MEWDEFAYLLTSWLSPGIVAKASIDWSNPPQGHEAVKLRFERADLRSSSDGQIGWFVRNFLEHFYVPEELRKLAAGFYPKQIDGGALQWLETPRIFTGELEFHDDSTDSKSLYTVHAPVFEIRLVWPCLSVLNQLVTFYYSYYMDIFDHYGTEDIHYPPHGEWPFLIWIGHFIAKSCGFTNAGAAGLSPPRSMTHMISNVRGTATVNGPLPTSSAQLDGIAILAHSSYSELSRDNELFERISKK